MKIFGWRLDCYRYGGPLFKWIATHVQEEMFPEKVLPSQQVEQERNLTHVSEYLPLGERDSDLPW